MAVCSQIHTKHINTLCGQKAELLNVKLAVHIVTIVLWTIKTLMLFTHKISPRQCSKHHSVPIANLQIFSPISRHFLHETPNAIWDVGIARRFDSPQNTVLCLDSSQWPITTRLDSLLHTEAVLFEIWWKSVQQIWACWVFGAIGVNKRS